MFIGRCIINVSPIEFGHCLFVPYGELPQVLTLQAIQSALKLMLLSRQSNFKIAFNREVVVYKSLPTYFLHLPFCHISALRHHLDRPSSYIKLNIFCLDLSSHFSWEHFTLHLFVLILWDKHTRALFGRCFIVILMGLWCSFKLPLIKSQKPQKLVVAVVQFELAKNVIHH